MLIVNGDFQMLHVNGEKLEIFHIVESFNFLESISFFVLNQFFQNCAICFSFVSLNILIYLGDMIIGFKESGCIADYTIF